MLSRCPKCQHAPLPGKQDFPAECPACGVILAKVGQPPPNLPRIEPMEEREEEPPRPVPVALVGLRFALCVAFASWGFVLIRLDVAYGEIGGSFIHRPLLVFHEAGHVLFMPFGEWMTVAGGTIGQLLMPVVMGIALWRANRDAFGVSLALWLFGVSLLDVAPYVYDAEDLQLQLLGGGTGEESFHDWLYLLRTMGLREKAYALGLGVHKVGAAITLAASAWGLWLVWRQWQRRER
jgi:hypothetical protein